MTLTIPALSKALFRILFVVLLLPAFKTKAQSSDSLKQKHINFFSKKLGVTHDKATQINTIHENYKSGVKQVMNDKSLDEKSRRENIDQLIMAKNTALSSMLTKEQQDKLIPNTERKKAIASANKKGINGQPLNITQYPESAAAKDTFSRKLKGLMLNTHLSPQQKHEAVSKLFQERNKNLIKANNQGVQAVTSTP